MGSADKARKEVGRLGEDAAAQFLILKGFNVIDRNYRKPWGEIDIIAMKDNTVHFVEVKSASRENRSDGSREMEDYRPEEQVHESKLRKLARTAELYMAKNRDDRQLQIDVVGVFLDVKNRRAKCRLYEQVL